MLVITSLLCISILLLLILGKDAHVIGSLSELCGLRLLVLEFLDGWSSSGSLCSSKWGLVMSGIILGDMGVTRSICCLQRLMHLLDEVQYLAHGLLERNESDDCLSVAYLCHC